MTDVKPSAMQVFTRSTVSPWSRWMAIGSSGGSSPAAAMVWGGGGEVGGDGDGRFRVLSPGGGDGGGEVGEVGVLARAFGDLEDERRLLGGGALDDPLRDLLVVDVDRAARKPAGIGEVEHRLG